MIFHIWHLFFLFRASQFESHLRDWPPWRFYSSPLSPSRQIPEEGQHLILGHSHLPPHPFQVYILYSTLDAVCSELLIVLWMSRRNSYPHRDLKPRLSSLWQVAKLTALSRPISKWYANNKNMWYRWNCNLIVFHLLCF